MHRRHALVALCTTAALAAPAAASASPANESFNASVASGSVDLGTYHVEGSEPLQQGHYYLDVGVKATWTGNLPSTLGWDSSNVRQGSPLAVSRMSPPVGNGNLKVTWKVDGQLLKVVVINDIHRSATKDVSCMPRLDGSAYDCTVTSPAIYLIRSIGIPNGLYAKLLLQTKFSITPEGAVLTRTLSMSGAPAGTPNDLDLSLLPKQDKVTVPCGPVGNAVSYALSPIHWTPNVTMTMQPVLQEGLMDPVFGLAETPALADKPWGPPNQASRIFDLKGSGHTTNLGPALANNVAPTISAVGNLTGKVGIPVHFWTVTSSRCPVSTYVWKFSNGTTSFGAAPQRTFDKPGVYDAQVTVKDQTGMSSTKQFTVTISK